MVITIIFCYLEYVKKKWKVVLIRILEISKNSPTTNRDIVGNWVKIENKKKFPNEIEESTENDGWNIEIRKKYPMADKYVGDDLGKY